MLNSLYLYCEWCKKYRLELTPHAIFRQVGWTSAIIYLRLRKTVHGQEIILKRGNDHVKTIIEKNCSKLLMAVVLGSWNFLTMLIVAIIHASQLKCCCYATTLELLASWVKCDIISYISETKLLITLSDQATIVIMLPNATDFLWEVESDLHDNLTSQNFPQPQTGAGGKKLTGLQNLSSLHLW